MITNDQANTINRDYRHLLKHENRGWDGLDDYIGYLEYLDDDQLHREADVIFAFHSKVNVKCTQDHPKEQCFIPILVEAAGAILEYYKDVGKLSERHKYILQYYLSMEQARAYFDR